MGMVRPIFSEVVAGWVSLGFALSVATIGTMHEFLRVGAVVGGVGPNWGR